MMSSASARKKTVSISTNVEVVSGSDVASTAKSTLDATWPPTFARRRKLQTEIGTPNGHFVGLYNLGATCYMNSLLQVLFMTPEFRQFILQWRFEEKQRHPMNVAYQLQLLFGRMQQVTLREDVRPTDLVKSFGMGEDAHREQHDVQELNRKLLEVFQHFIDVSGGEQLLHKLYRGVYSDYRICVTCRTKRESQMPFDDVSLPIRGHATLAESFAAYERPEEIEGIDCSSCARKETIQKGMRISEYPAVLTIQLLRMDYSPIDFRREKITTDYSLPLEITLPAAGEEAGALHETTSPQSFTLHSIIAHRGTAYHGHYYAFVRCADGTWIKFDDSTVTTVANLDEVLQYRDPAEWRRAGPAPQTTPEVNGGGAAVPPAASTSGSSAQTASTSSSGATDDGEQLDAELLNSVFGEGGLGSSATSAATRDKVSGHSYYAVYRRADLPPVTRGFIADVAPHVAEVLEAESRDLVAKRAELDALANLVSVGLHFGGRRQWIDVDLQATIAQLQQRFVEALTRSGPDGEAEAVVAAAASGTPMRLRAYSETLKCLGDSYDPSATLASIGVNPESTCFANFALEILDLEFAVDGFTETRGWDHGFSVHWPKEDSDVEFEVDVTRVYVPSTGSLLDLQRKLMPRARDLLGVASPGELCITVRRDGDGRANVATDAARAAAIALAKDLGFQSEDHIFVERIDRTRWDYEGKGESRAVAAIAKANQIAVRFKLLPVTGDDDADASVAASQTFHTTTIDRRRSVQQLKEQLCTQLGLEVAATQILLDNATRELRNLSMSVQTMALGQHAITVAIDPRPPIPSDHSLVDVFVGNAADYTKPVVKVARTSIAPTATVEELLSQECVLGALPSSSTAFRARLMPPGKNACLGLPMLHSVVVKNCPVGHRTDELRVVFEPIAAPDAPPLTKDSLILHVHRWNAAVEDPAVALGLGHELVVDRNATAREVRDAALAKLGLLANTSDGSTTDPSVFDVASAKYYLVRTHDSVCAKLRWDHFQSDKILAKSVHAHPLKLEMDDIVLVRPRDEPWPFAEGASVAAKRASDERIMQQNSGVAVKIGADGDGKGGNGSKKGRPAERGITIQAVWDAVETAVAGEIDDVPSVQLNADASATAAAAEAAPEVAPVSSGGPGTDAATAAGGNGCSMIDFLPYDTYSPAIHGSLESLCNICTGEFEDGEVICTLGCSHIFHRECLAPWLQIKPTCPQCAEHVLQ